MKPDRAQQSGSRHDAETADHAFSHEQPRSYDTVAKAQRNQRHSHETGNDKSAHELERQPPPEEIKQHVGTSVFGVKLQSLVTQLDARKASEIRRSVTFGGANHSRAARQDRVSAVLAAS